MPECPELQRILEQVGDEYADHEREAIRRHIERCGVCRAQFERLRWLSPVVREIGRTDAGVEDHLTDLQIAEFAESGYACDGAEEIVTHLSQCRQCREAATAAWTAASARSTPPDRALGSPCPQCNRVLCGVGAALAFIAECFLLAVAAAQFALAWLVEPRGFDAVPDVWPLATMPGSMAFWLLVAVCVAGAVLLRWAGGRMLSCAKRPAAEFEPAT